MRLSFIQTFLEENKSGGIDSGTFEIGSDSLYLYSSDTTSFKIIIKQDSSMVLKLAKLQVLTLEKIENIINSWTLTSTRFSQF